MASTQTQAFAHAVLKNNSSLKGFSASASVSQPRRQPIGKELGLVAIILQRRCEKGYPVELDRREPSE